MTSVLVRAATPADAEGLALLGAQVAAQPLLQRYGVTAAGLAQELHRLALLQPPAPDPAQGEGGPAVVAPPSLTPRLLLATCGGAPQPCGFARYLREGSLGAGGYLQLIALAPGSEGAGVGSALLQAVEAAVARHTAHLFLLTADFNHAAQRFYLRHGYHQAGALPAFARPDITELLFWKRLRG